jgi:hypothetical protein
MDTNNDNKTMNTKRNDDFQTIWECRKQNWQERAEKGAPDNKTFLHWAEMAQQDPAGWGMNVLPLHHTRRWIPYAAAACIAVGVTVIGLSIQSQPDNPLPVTEEVTIEGQTFHFLCNNGCSAQDILLSANEVIK